MMADIEKLEAEILARIEADRMPEPDWMRGLDLPEGWTAATVSAWALRSAESVCEPRTRAVPEVGSVVVGAPWWHTASSVGSSGPPDDLIGRIREAAAEIWAATDYQTPLAMQPFGYDDFSRGFTYADLMNRLADGFYPEDVDSAEA